MNFYGITWQYEPVEFTLSYGRDGRPSSAFRPDFYLPGHDLFIELTTLRQELVTRKNRKVRLLQELYPEIRVKILYRRDVASLALKTQLAQGDFLAPREQISTREPAKRSA